jgi:hypothetical protein
MKRFLSIIIASLVLTFAPLSAGSTFGVSVARAETKAAAAVSTSEAQHVFDVMARQKDIAFRYVLDGCYARAHLMIQRMEKMGINASKAWSFPSAGSKLKTRSSLAKGGVVTWEYHVAPTINVMVNGKATWMVIDPSMFKGPVTLAEWASAQKCSKTGKAAITRVTAIGEAPVLPSGAKAPGHGYWPGADPAEGMAAHAMKMMRKFKSMEPH